MTMGGSVANILELLGDYIFLGILAHLLRMGEPKYFTFLRWLDTPSSSSDKVIGSPGFVGKAKFRPFITWSEMTEWVNVPFNHGMFCTTYRFRWKTSWRPNVVLLVVQQSSSKSLSIRKNDHHIFLQVIRCTKLSKKSPTGPSERTPEKPEYLIAQSQLTERGPLVRYHLISDGNYSFCLEKSYPKNPGTSKVAILRTYTALLYRFKPSKDS